MAEKMTEGGEAKRVLTVEEQIEQAVGEAVTRERRVAAATNVTAVDGRYGNETHPSLSPIVSEHALMRNRATGEALWLKLLLSGKVTDQIPAVSDEALAALDKIIADFSVDDSLMIKDYEATTNHDVKALEYWFRDAMGHTPELRPKIELSHLGLTSEDANNIALAIMMRQLLDEVFLPKLNTIQQDLAKKAFDWADIPMLGMTHGQAATPTTLGKTFAVPAHRLGKQITGLQDIEIEAKLNGATGNWNALYAADPDTNWPEISKVFVESLGFKFNPITTQIESMDWFIDIAYKMAHIDGILRGLSVDTWLQIQRKVLAQELEKGTTGSSTMPQKINPIRFENNEGNMDMAAANWIAMANKLVYSRLERDLSGSTVVRSLGNVAGLQVVGFNNLTKGLGKISPNRAYIAKELEGREEVLGEALQTVMRINSQYEGAPNSYERLKALTQGKDDFDRAAYEEFVRNEPSLRGQDTQSRMLALTPATYLGKAAEIARGEIAPLGK